MYRSTRTTLFGLVDIPADFADVDRVLENGLNRGAAPIERRPRRGNAHFVEAQRQRVGASPFDRADVPLLAGGVEPEDKADNIGLGLHRAQRPALVVRHPDALVAIGGHAGHPFPLFGGGKAAALQAAVDGLILPAGHEKAKLEILLVVLVVWVVDLEGGYDFGAGILERLRHNPLVDGITTGQPLHLDDENTLPQPLLHLLEELLHDRPGGDRLAGDDLPVNLGDVVGAAPGDLKEELFVTG